MGVGEGLTLVPVPWASMYSRDSGATPTGSYMEHNSCFWASPEGKVTPVGWARPQHPTRCPCRAWGPLPPAPTLLLVAICVGAGIQDGGVHPPGQGLPGQQHSQYGLRAAVAFPWGQRAPQAEPGPQGRSSGWQCGVPCSWQSSGSGIGGRCPVAPCPLPPVPVACTLTACVEGFAGALGAEHAQLHELHGGVGFQQQVDAAHDGRGALPPADGLVGVLQSQQAGGACCVQSYAGPCRQGHYNARVGAPGGSKGRPALTARDFEASARRASREGRPEPARSQEPPTFEVKAEGKAVGHHGTLAAHHAVAQKRLGVSAQSL